MVTNRTDLEMVLWNFVRNHYENQSNKHIPLALKRLILKFSNTIIGCRMLSYSQDLRFFKLLSKKLPSIHQFKLLHRASQHLFSADMFHLNCDNKGPSLVIIKSNFGNIFGGYSSKGWRSTMNKTWIKDENAFLYLIESKDYYVMRCCPMIFGIRPDCNKDAICSQKGFGPLFGYDIFIGDKCDKSLDLIMENLSDVRAFSRECTFEQRGFNISGGISKCGQTYFQVIDYEVFSVSFD